MNSKVTLSTGSAGALYKLAPNSKKGCYTSEEDDGSSSMVRHNGVGYTEWVFNGLSGDEARKLLRIS